jgi:hypothetical protein
MMARRVNVTDRAHRYNPDPLFFDRCTRCDWYPASPTDSRGKYYGYTELEKQHAAAIKKASR